jgi:two-component system, NtrC family, sensor kinase
MGWRSTTGGKASKVKARKANRAKGRGTTKTKRRGVPPATPRKRLSLSNLQKQLEGRTVELNESQAQQTASAEILKVINASVGELTPVFDIILEKAHSLCDVATGSLQLYEGGVSRAVAVRGMPKKLEEFLRQGFNVTDQIQGTAPERHFQIVDLAQALGRNPDHFVLRASVELGDIRTMLSIPLVRNGLILGRIVASRQQVRPFTDHQIALLSSFADQAVIAIENVRLFDEVRARTLELSESLEFQTVTSDVLNVISRSTTDVQPVFDAIVTSAARLFAPCEVTLTTVQGGQLHWKATASLGRPVEAVKRASAIYPIPFDAEHIPSARAMLGRRIIEIADATAEDTPATTKRAQAAGEFRSITFVPLLTDDGGIGTIILTNPEAGFRLSEKQLALVKTFADQAVIAIENARLFKEVQARTRELSQSLDGLRTAQDRLVQTEKLASLGQLTAGIAHEIKNPLNFVNNFSALCAELIDELGETLAPAPLDQKMRGDVGELTQMLKSNLEKVVQHGKRADSIVKNMLLHSREGSGEHRPADINALVEESLNLAYHGARAEKPGFHITLTRDLDPAAGVVELYPQEIMRALLNLISNGFYAATKRKSAAEDDTFEPALSAVTRNLGSRVEIRIRDNGIGIQPDVRAKMFNPFFTTKPAGEGTGLGLSMSHDIIVKQHGGRIEVETAPGVFTEFIITLPRNAASQAKAGDKQ